MKDSTESIKNLTDKIVRSLPFLLDPKVNEAASVVIYDNMQKCLEISNSVSDIQSIGNTLQILVNYAREYNISGLMSVCARWNNVAREKLETFKKHESKSGELSEDYVFRMLDSLEVVVNNPDMQDAQVLNEAREELDSLEDRIKSSSLPINVVKNARYRISMLRGSLNVSLVIIADLSSVRRLLNNARRFS